MLATCYMQETQIDNDFVCKNFLNRFDIFCSKSKTILWEGEKLTLTCGIVPIQL